MLIDHHNYPRFVFLNAWLTCAILVMPIPAQPPHLEPTAITPMLLTRNQQRALSLLQHARPTEPIRLFLFVDPNKDPDDLTVLVDVNYLQRHGFFELRGAVTTLGNLETRTARAKFLRSVFSELGLEGPRVAVGIDYRIEARGPDGSVDAVATAKRKLDHSVFMDSPLLNSSAEVEADSLAMLQSELAELPDHSAGFVVNAGMADLAELLRLNPGLVQRKLAQVVIMGGVDSKLDSRGFVVADQRAYNNSTHQSSADFTYTTLQQLGVPLVIVTKEASYAVAISRSFYESVAATRHPIGIYLESQQKQSLQNLWNGITQGHLPAALTPEWFFRTFTEVDCDSNAGKAVLTRYQAQPDNFDEIWKQVNKFNLYDPLTLLAATPGAAEMLFATHVPNGCRSKVQIIGRESIKNATLMKDLLAGISIESLKPSTPIKSRSQIGKGYPARQPVAEADAAWSQPMPNYFPPEYTAGVVFQNEGKWADPRDLRDVKRKFMTLNNDREEPVTLDALGRPLNPLGRTGLQGRGLLGRWGRNLAGDPLVTRVSPEHGRIQLLVIERKDLGLKALPGGMVDEGEDIATTVARELSEETSAKLDFSNATKIFAGVVDDPRNTDNAWMETTVLHRHLTTEEQAQLTLKAGDDASAVHWVDINQELMSAMYASHADYVRMAMRHLSNNPALAEQLKAQLPN